MGQTPTLLLKTNAERNTRASGAMQHKKKMRDARRQACLEWKEESDFPTVYKSKNYARPSVTTCNTFHFFNKCKISSSVARSYICSAFLAFRLSLLIFVNSGSNG
mmetsp:Transcript_22617/g.38578  ORF Transcript_22617/g.38578 Transcript_22617/m.38578 type:complete len:105 (-) Transcript_22617:685-999(-)